MAHLVQVNRNFKGRGFQIVSVSGEPGSKIDSYISGRGYDFGIAQSPGIGELYGYRGVPHSWLISPTGSVVWRGHPARLTNQIVERHLGQAKAGTGAGSGTTGSGAGGVSADGSESGGPNYWLWGILVCGILGGAGIAYFLWSSRDRSAQRYREYTYGQMEQPPRPPQPQAVPQPPAEGQAPPQGQPPPQDQPPPQAAPAGLPVFSYVATDGQGQQVEGALEAIDLNAAIAALESSGLANVSVTKLPQ